MIVHSLRRYLLAGLVVWVPLIATLLIIKFVVDLLSSISELFPMTVQSSIPGMGILISLFAIVFTGFLATNLLGKKLFALWEGILAKIPFVRSVYKATKQISETVLIGGGNGSFRRVLLVEYPRPGLWTLGFQANIAPKACSELAGVPLLSVFIPTTPNPTSGFLIFVPETAVQSLNMSVDEALKQILSMGVVV